MLIASLPSPSRGVYYLGPLPLHAYGLALAVGVLVAARVTERRWVARGHPATEFADLVIWVVVAGSSERAPITWCRIFQLFTGDPWKIVAIWQGGLSIWGAVAGGAVGQAIGRSGNWFNQEIFGEPTTLPWGLEIDRIHRPLGYEHFATFHPTFLYEPLYALIVFAALVWMELVPLFGSARSRRAVDGNGRSRSTAPLGDMSPLATTIVRFQHRERGVRRW